MSFRRRARLAALTPTTSSSLAASSALRGQDTHDQFAANERTQAVIRNVEIIGEAAKHIPDEGHRVGARARLASLHQE